MSKLFLHLLNISITAGWIVLVVVLLRFVLKKAPKWTRVVLWGLVALRLLLPVSIESPLSLVPSEQTVSIATWTLPDTAVGTSEEGSAAQRTTAERVVFQTGFPALNSAINPTMKQSYEHHSTVSTVKVVAGWVWLGGAVAMLLYALISFLRLKHRVRASVLLEKGVYVCDEISDPFILGLIVPKIYLPSGMDEQTRAYVLAHERAHLKRFDHIWKPLGFLLLSVYWFNPLLWLAYILLCRDIELACDEKVVKELDDTGKAAYSEALVTASVSRRSIAACPLAFGETGVKSRVKSVLNYKKPAFWIILVALLAGIVTAVCFLTVPKKDKTVTLSYDGSPALWFDDWDYGNDPGGPASVRISSFPNVTFLWENNGAGGTIIAKENGKTRTLFTGMPIENVYFSDVTGDQKPELCASVYFGSGMIDEHVVVYDYVNKQSYTLWDRGTFDYHLYTADGKLLVGKTPYNGDKQVDYGIILCTNNGEPVCLFYAYRREAWLSRELHESALYGEWIVEEEWDNDGNTLYTFDVASTWKEYNFREDGTVTYNETVPISSDSELAFGHPVAYPYEVHDNYVYIAGDNTSGAFRWGQSDRDTRTLTLMYSTDAGTVYAKLRRMGTEGPQTIEEILLGTYVCTGAEQNGVSIPIPAEYASMTIDLGDTSEGDTYKHTSTVTIGGETMDGHGWTLDEDDMLLVWNQKTGKSMWFDWFPKQTACTTLKLTIEQADPITLIFTVEDDALPAPNVVMPEANADTADALDEATLCTIWTLVEIEASDGSNGDARALGLEQYLVFRSDGTVRIVERDGQGYAERIAPYTWNGNTVRYDDTVLRYDSEDRELVLIDAATQDIFFYAPSPNAVLPEATPQPIPDAVSPFDQSQYHKTVPVGEVPEEFKEVVAQNLFYEAIAGKDRLLTGRALATSSHLYTYQYTLRDRYGDLLAEVSIPIDSDSLYPGPAMIVSDGGFVATIVFEDHYRSEDQCWASEQEDVISCILKYDASGKLQWKTELPNVNGYALHFCIERNGAYYFFGDLETPETKRLGVASRTDLYLLKIGADGSILKEQTYGGSDYDMILMVDTDGDCFVIDARIQSTDGDFPAFSDWRITVDSDFAIVKKEQIENARNTSYVGTVDGKRIYTDDPRFRSYPDGNVRAILSYDSFDLIISENMTGVYENQPLYISSIWYLTETVYAAYDKQGNLLWKAAVDSSPDYDSMVKLP